MFHFEDRLHNNHFSSLNYYYGRRNELERKPATNGFWDSSYDQRGYYEFVSATERYPESIVSSGSDDYDESFTYHSHIISEDLPTVRNGSLPDWDADTIETRPFANRISNTFADQTLLGIRERSKRNLPLQKDSPIFISHSNWTNFSQGNDIDSAYGNFCTPRGDNKICARHFGEDHLSEIKATKRYISAPVELSNFTDSSDCEINALKRKKKKKKRYRPFAAQRERERLIVMNSALKKLKTCLPWENQKQKLSKKDILQTATLYIKHLAETLEQTSSQENLKTLNLSKHNYLINQGLRFN